ncbi:unnamed protein product [Trichobilharzia szidati]|nr:unnamed protein product [Trichobilharzia szidati]
MIFSLHDMSSNIFCTDEMLTHGFTLHDLGTHIPIEPKVWNSYQKLTSNETKNSVIKIFENQCLHSHEEFGDSCTKTVRGLLIEQIKKLSNENITKKDEKILMNLNSIDKVKHSKPFYTQFLYAICILATISIQSLSDPYSVKMHYNPCVADNLCNTKEECKPDGIFSSSYSCVCPEGKTWKSEYSTCLSDDEYNDIKKRDKLVRYGELTKRLETTPKNCPDVHECNKEGTLSCVYDREHRVTLCACKPQYHGSKCEKLIDACKYRVDHPFQPNGGTLLPGNIACNINTPNKNKCFSYISSEGYAFYKCQCDNNYWLPDFKLSYPNCMKKQSICDNIICLHGYCYASYAENEAYCICDQGYSGKACNIWVGEWSEWSAWDKCRPACGDVRYSVRSRECLSAAWKKKPGQCLGSPIEYTKCPEHECSRGEGTFLGSYFAIRQNSLAISFSTGAIISIMLIICWIFLCWGAVSYIILPNLRKLRVIQNLEARYSTIDGNN